MGPIQLYQSYLLLYFICSTRWQCRFSPYLCESFFVTLTIKSSSCKKDTPLANTFLTKRCLFLFFLICHINSHKPLYPMAAQTMLRCRLPSPTGNRAPPRPSASPRAQPQGAPPHAALAPERPQGHAVVPRVVGSGRGLSGLIIPPFLLHFGEITAAEHFPTERASRGAVPLEDQQGFASEPFVSIAHCGRHVAGREPSLAPSKTLEIRLPLTKAGRGQVLCLESLPLVCHPPRTRTFFCENRRWKSTRRRPASWRRRDQNKQRFQQCFN